MGKTIPIAFKMNDSHAWAVDQMCLECIEDIKNGDRGNETALILTLDKTNNQYKSGYYIAGMTMSEAISLLEVVKATFLKEMGY